MNLAFSGSRMGTACWGGIVDAGWAGGRSHRYETKTEEGIGKFGSRGRRWLK